MNGNASLDTIAHNLVKRGILAADESHGTVDKPGTMRKRLSSVGLEPSDANIIAYRQMLFSAPGLEEQISGIIVTPETLAGKVEEQPTATYLRNKGIISVVKVDTGSHPRIEPYKQQNTTGSDNLHARLSDYRKWGAQATKWRAVFTISDATPTNNAIAANVDGLSLYARLVQDAGLVPIVEPEILHEGKHSIDSCYYETGRVLRALFSRLREYGVYMPGMVLKPSMVLAGKDYHPASEAMKIARATYACMENCVPASVGGVAFLSGGQSDEQAVQNLNMLNQLHEIAYHQTPWRMTFSFGRGLVAEPLKIWAKNGQTPEDPQHALLERAQACLMASQGLLPSDFQYRYHA